MAWTIIILTALLIGSLSVSWSTLPAIPNIISIALGLSSLVLAMVAIVQAVSGSSSLNKSLGKIESAADKALSATAAVELAAEVLSSRSAVFEQIPPSIDAIHRKIDDLSTSNLKASEPPESLSNDQINKSEDDPESKAYALGTVGGNLSMYVALKSFQSGGAFDASDIFENKYIAGQVNGFLIAMRMMDAIKMDYVGGNMIINDMGIFTPENVRSRFLNSTSDNSLSKFRDIIDKFFGKETEKADTKTE